MGQGSDMLDDLMDYEEQQVESYIINKKDNIMTNRVLTDKERQEVIKFVINNIRCIKSINYNITSYRLKHIISKLMNGLYMTNEDMKLVMFEAEYGMMPEEMINVEGKHNFYFSISQKSIKDLERRCYTSY